MNRILLFPLLAAVTFLHAEKPSLYVEKFNEQIPELGKVPNTIQIRNALVHEIEKTVNGWEAVISGEIYSFEKNGEAFLLMADRSRISMTPQTPIHEMSEDDEKELEDRLNGFIGKRGWILVKEASITLENGKATKTVGKDVSLLKSKKNGGF